MNGTFVAVGTSSERIHITNGTKIESTEFSNGWNEQTGSGCIIKNAVIEVLIDNNVSLKLDNNILGGIHVGDSSIISNNAIGGSVTAGSSNIISNNTISRNVFVGSSCSILNNTISGIVEATKSEISNNIIMHSVNYYYDPFTGRQSYSDPGPAIQVHGDSTIFNNTITGELHYVGISVESGPVYISGNAITDAGVAINAVGGATIEGNLLIGNDQGIVLSKSNAIVRDNIITGGTQGIVGISGGTDLIEKNLIINPSVYGMYIDMPAVIQNNTLVNNTVGIHAHKSMMTVNYNNIQNCSANSIYLTNAVQVNATYNWWGTTDIDAVNQTIYDLKYDFNLGTVSFVPLLTEPNPEAAPNPNSEIPEFPSWIILSLFLIATLLVTVCRKRLVC